MNFSLYKSQQKLEIIDLFQNTFSDSEGSEEGTVIGKVKAPIIIDIPISKTLFTLF